MKQANLKTDRSREALVDSYKMADANTKWAIEQGIVLESKLMEMFNQAADRVIRYALAKMGLSSVIFKNLIDAYLAQVDAVLKEAQLKNEIQRTEISAYLGKLSYYKTMADVGLGKVDALIKKYGVDISKYTAQISLSEVQGQINLAQVTRDTQSALLTWKSSLEALQQNLVSNLHYTQIHSATVLGETQILSNYVAAMSNSMNAVMQLSVTETIAGA